jgi:flagellar hook-associated protein 2
MSGGFNIGGLMTGLDSNSIISQLMQIERQPLVRMQARVKALEQQKEAIRSLRTQLSTLRSKAQDFRFDTIFNRFKATSTEEKVLRAEVGGENPVAGSYVVNVTRLASATTAVGSASVGAAIDPAAALNSSGMATEVTGTKFSINGVQFTFDPATDSLNDVLNQINSSAAGVTATYDAASDRVVLVNAAAGDTSLINLGGEDDDSNLLQVLGLTGATQATNASGSTELRSTRNLGAVNPSANLADEAFAGGAITSGTFFINGVSITVDAATDSIADVLGRINDSDAQVTASYDSATDTIRLVSKAMGSRTIRLVSGTSNFLEVTNLTTAIQTAGQDAEFTVNGGPVQTRNSNDVSDAIGGVTLHLLSEGTSTVAVGSDDDAIVEQLQGFIDEFNKSVEALDGLLKKGGTAENDGSLRLIQNFLRSTIFSRVEGAGEFTSIAQIGITTGDSFDSQKVSKLELDKEAFLEAFRENRSDVERLFANDGKTGVADLLFTYLDGVTSTGGFLNERIRSNGSIDEQIKAYNGRMERLEDRLAQREQRLRAQFNRLEQLSSTFQAQSAALSRLTVYY